MNNRKIRWRSGPAMKQNFPFRDNLIYYITMHPNSAKAYDKMIQSCKYFFEANPIVTIQKIRDNNIENGESQCCIEFRGQKIACKFWFHSTLLLEEHRIFNSHFPAKIYKCEIQRLEIKDTKIRLHDLKILGELAEIVDITDIAVIHDNGRPVMFDEILKALPKSKHIKYPGFNYNYNVTITNIQEVPPKLQYLKIYGLTESFKIREFYAFSKQHKEIRFSLCFGTIITRYLDQLEAIIRAENRSSDDNLKIYSSGVKITGRGAIYRNHPYYRRY